MTDPIADMLTRIRNASAAGKAEVVLPFSKIKHTVAKVLEAQNYLSKVDDSVDAVTEHRQLRLVLKYRSSGKSAIRHIRRISKPSHKVYVTTASLPRVLNGHGLAVISTSQGVLTDAEARQKKVGGEVMFEIW